MTVQDHTIDTVGGVLLRRAPSGQITAAYEQITAPVLGPDQLLVEPAFVGICGTDIEQLHGRMPATFHISFPHTIGHEWSGTVRGVGDAVTGFAVGDRVLGHGHLGGNDWFGVTHDGAMSEIFAVPASMCFAVPESVSMESAAVIEPFACVVNAVRKIGGIAASDTVHVYGLGAIGLSAVLQAVTAGAQVVAFDPSELRRELALSLGAAAAVDSRHADGLGERVSQAVGRPFADVVIEATGVPLVQAMALESADEHGRVLLMGVSVPAAVPARLGLIQQRLLTVTTSVGAPPEIWPAAIAFVENAKLDLAPFVSSILRFTECEDALARAQQPGLETKILLRP